LAGEKYLEIFCDLSGIGGKWHNEGRFRHSEKAAEHRRNPKRYATKDSVDLIGGAGSPLHAAVERRNPDGSLRIDAGYEFSDGAHGVTRPTFG